MVAISKKGFHKDLPQCIKLDSSGSLELPTEKAEKLLLVGALSQWRNKGASNFTKEYLAITLKGEVNGF